MFLALLAYRRALRDSSIFLADGDTQTKSNVLWSPPNDPLRIRVSLESRNGTNLVLGLLGSILARADMTFPSTNRPLLMSMPSFNLCPTAPVRFTRSLPAKSTKLNFDLMTVFSVSMHLTCSIRTDIIAWLRLLSAFIAVAAVTRFSIPRVRQRRASSALETSTDVAPRTSQSFFVSRMVSLALDPDLPAVVGANRSRMSSPYSSRN